MPQQPKHSKVTQADVPPHLYLTLSYQGTITARKKYSLSYNTVLLFMYYSTLEHLGYQLTKRRVLTIFKSFNASFIRYYTAKLLEHGLIISHTSLHRYTSLPYDFYTISDKGSVILSEIEDGFYLFYRKVVEKRS